MQNTKTRILVECAVMIALAAVLSMIKIYEAPLGGAVTLFSMAPLIVISFRHGPKWGFASSFVYSMTQLLLGLGSLSWVPTPMGIFLCVVFDFVVAFTFIGVAAFFRPKDDASNKKTLIMFVAAALTVCLLRFGAHLVSGAVVWYEITKAGQWNDLVMKTSMWTYSFIYNITYMLPETIITVIAVPAMAFVLSAVGGRRGPEKKS